MTVALQLPVLGARERVSLVRSQGWAVASRSESAKGVRLTRLSSGLRLLVADAGSAHRCTQVDLHADGTVRVHATTTPPALLVSGTDARPLPALPGFAQRARLDSGQRLLVLSSDALDALPVSVAAVLQSLPSRLARGEPQEVLRALTADLDAGSAVIVAREGGAHAPGAPAE